MKCIVSGGTGFIGRRLVDSLLRDGHYVGVWSRRPGIEKRDAVASFFWNPLDGEPPAESLDSFDAVVHLAGEPVFQRWTPDTKRRIRDSRVLGTRRLVGAMAKVTRPPSVLVCASAVGYYGPHGDEPVDEETAPGSDFLADVCREWEHEADRARELGIRVVRIRFGVVLGSDGGALKAMLPTFLAFAGGRLGSGKQWFPWIHADDLIAMLRRAIDDVDGVWNGTAPNPVTNAEFTRLLAKELNRPALLAVPAFAVRLALGEMANTVLTGARVLPHAAERNGFVWKYPELPAALKAAV